MKAYTINGMVPRYFATGSPPAKRQDYTPAEDQFIRDHWQDMTDKEIAEALGRTEGAIRHRRQKKLDLKKYEQHSWSADELNYLQEHYPCNPTQQVADDMGLTFAQVNRKAHIMGIEKDKEYLEAMREETNRKLAKAGASTRFNAGHEPFNKGKCQEEYMDPEAIERTKQSRFEPGHKPHNTKWDGAISIRQDSNGYEYAYIRISEGNWKLYHRHVWEREHGPIPDGHLVVFKNGNQLDCRPENLELITHKENARRNHNPEKFKQWLEEHGSASMNLSDNFVGAMLAGGDRELRDHLVENRPDLIELARKNYELKRSIRDVEEEK